MTIEEKLNIIQTMEVKANPMDSNTLLKIEVIETLLDCVIQVLESFEEN